jgi:hypothetical protein
MGISRVGVIVLLVRAVRVARVLAASTAERLLLGPCVLFDMIASSFYAMNRCDFCKNTNYVLRRVNMKANNDQWTGRQVQGMLMNPVYAITLHPDLFGDHEPMVSHEKWIAANAQLIEQMGATTYLQRLLEILAGDFPRQPEGSERD